MKKIILALMLFTQSAWCNDLLKIGSASPEQFQVSIDNENPMQLLIKKGSAQDSQKVKFDYTVSDFQKIVVSLQDKNGKDHATEMLVVVLSVGNAQQDIKVFVPVRRGDMIISSEINPICTIKNYGDFSWDDNHPEQLHQRVEVLLKEKVAQLNFLVKSSEDKAAVAQWKNCGSIRLPKNVE